MYVYNYYKKKMSTIIKDTPIGIPINAHNLHCPALLLQHSSAASTTTHATYPRIIIPIV